MMSPIRLTQGLRQGLRQGLHLGLSHKQNQKSVRKGNVSCPRAISDKCGSAINNQISKELVASYVYEEMYAFYTRVEIALPGLAQFALYNSQEEKEHAKLFMDYLNKRGSHVHIQRPQRSPLFSPFYHMPLTHQEVTKIAEIGIETTLFIEKSNYDALLELHQIAEKEKDVSLMDFVSPFLTHQIDAIYENQQMKTRFTRFIDNGTTGLHLFDDLLKTK